MWLKLRHLFSKYQGTDALGNRYYTTRFKNTSGRYARWVSYKSRREASKVPASWHGWLHYVVDELPTTSLSEMPSWVKPHRSNMTGTSSAILPKAHFKRGQETEQ